MSKKTFILSSAGLKNIFQNQNNDEEFTFNFGKYQIKMKTFFAEFISPYISQIHQADPTINCIDFPIKKLNNNQMNNDDSIQSILNLLDVLMKGESIEINRSQGRELQKVSILLQNDELYSKISELFPSGENDSEKVEESLNFLNFIKSNSISTNKININEEIEFLSEHFYLIDESKINELSTDIFYSILKSNKLTIESEDELFELIENFFNEKENDCETENTEELDRISFYEEIDFEFMSEEKFRQFIENLNINEVTNNLFSKIKKCFYYNKQSNKAENNHNHHYNNKQKTILIEYDNNKEHAFNGIIHELTKKFGGNVDDKNIVKVTSSLRNGTNLEKYAVDLDDASHYFQSYSKENSWLMFDFKERKVKPTHYSIRTRNDYGKGGWHPKNWDIEGSNDGEKWTTLDSRRDVMCLDNSNVVHTFEIQNLQKIDEFFRYLRIKSTGHDTRGAYHLTLSALEYFGSLIDL